MALNGCDSRTDGIVRMIEAILSMRFLCAPIFWGAHFSFKRNAVYYLPKGRAPNENTKAEAVALLVAAMCLLIAVVRIQESKTTPKKKNC